MMGETTFKNDIYHKVLNISISEIQGNVFLFY